MRNLPEKPWQAGRITCRQDAKIDDLINLLKAATRRRGGGSDGARGDHKRELAGA